MFNCKHTILHFQQTGRKVVWELGQGVHRRARPDLSEVPDQAEKLFIYEPKGTCLDNRQCHKLIATISGSESDIFVEIAPNVDPKLEELIFAVIKVAQ